MTEHYLALRAIVTQHFDRNPELARQDDVVRELVNIIADHDTLTAEVKQFVAEIERLQAELGRQDA